ncbi:MAG: hypothetical protein IKX89_01060, partial [Firmicutes bacterium]|nr:hypothetical protein [Bacillota bacterium]
MSKKKLLALLLTLVMVLSLIPQVSFAADEEGLNPDGSPRHSKTRTNNGDGTYKIELAVTGDSDDESESDSHINVLIIYDESSSMVSS